MKSFAVIYCFLKITKGKGMTLKSLLCQLCLSLAPCEGFRLNSIELSTTNMVNIIGALL